MELSTYTSITQTWRLQFNNRTILCFLMIWYVLQQTSQRIHVKDVYINTESVEHFGHFLLVEETGLNLIAFYSRRIITNCPSWVVCLWRMVFGNLRFMRLLYLMPFVAALCSASNKRNSSSDFHDAFNRSVLLNRASEYYLGMIFEEYAENLTGIISAKRFKDLLHDLKLGETVVTSGQSHHRHTRSLDGPSGEIVSRFAGQQTKHRHQGSPVDKLKSLNEELQRNSAKSRERIRRNIDENRNSHEKVRCILLSLLFSFFFFY